MYDALSQDYDRFVNWQERLAYELPFLEKILDSIPIPEGKKLRILDTACGTGMHAIALARRGYAVVGSDLSPKMIAQAKQNAEHAGVQVRFETVGFGEQATLFGEQSFDAVLCLGNSLPHLLTEEDVIRALTDFYHLLRPSGIVVIQNRNFDQILETRQREMEPRSVREEDREWIFVRFYDFLENGLIQFNFLTLFRRGEEAWRQNWQSSLLKPLLAYELSYWLNRVGFCKICLFGNLVGEAFDPACSPNLVVLASKD
ncbi:MAG: methyltransferase domain-containing protein [Anaerolineales bacterium]|nr:class I SAM-dependent methyltransferase [Anaerolineales bacterium]MDW8446264.1 methyltransferase domain-containing protein [Anaerolineales bacterium]